MRIVLLVSLWALAGCSNTPLQSDWERAHLGQTSEEDAVALPRYPRDADLLPLRISPGPGFRFFVDGSTLSVGKDRVVRYALVARSSQGPDNVTFEGMRCATREYRIYAFGHADHSWAQRESPWLPLRHSDAAPVRRELERQYLCPGGRPVDHAAEVRAALRHPGPASDVGD